jgi:hypothetical protein
MNDSIMDDTDINDVNIASSLNAKRISRSFIVASSSFKRPLFEELMKNEASIYEVEEPAD